MDKQYHEYKKEALRLFTAKDYDFPLERRCIDMNKPNGEGLETPREWINGVDKTPDPPEWVSGNHPQNITLKVSGYSDEQIAYIMELEEQADSLKVLLAVVMTMLGAGGLVAYAAYKVGLIAVVL